jgi:hypothetical protein
MQGILTALRVSLVRQCRERIVPKVLADRQTLDPIHHRISLSPGRSMSCTDPNESQLDLVRLRGHILVAKLSTVRGKSAWQRQRITKFRAAAEIKAGTRKAQARNNRAGKAAEIRRAALKPTRTGLRVRAWLEKARIKAARKQSRQRS